MQAWIQTLNLSRCLVRFLLPLPFLLLIGGTGAAAETGHSELDLGIARFALETGDNAMALRFTRNPETEQGALVRAKALLNTGSQNEATSLLNQLIDGRYYRGEAALLKATLTTLGGGDQDEQKSKKLQLLRLASEKGHDEIRQQALYELAELARTDGQPERAGQILASMDSGYWAALGYMNIAADYAKQDLNPSRSLIALRVAMAMTDPDPDKARGKALKSELLVRAGLLAYESANYDKAIRFLEQVPLDSYHTPQGLYLHGLALSARGNQRDAMQSWHRAKKYPLAFPGVAESWLGAGRGYDLSGYLGQAGEAYLSASSSYESERATLRALTDLIREKGAYQAMVHSSGQAQTAWFLADSRMLTQPRNAYLLRFMENAGAQQRVQRVRDLTAMLERMNRQGRALAVFRSVLAERLDGSTKPKAALPGHFVENLKAISERIAAARETVSAGAAKPRELKQLALTLSDLKTSAERFDDRVRSRKQRLGRLMITVDRAEAELNRNRERAAKVLKQANTELDQRMLAYVERETDRMTLALEKAEQQIAHLYEYLALQTIDRSSP